MTDHQGQINMGADWEDKTKKKMDSNPKVMATFYKAIIQSILLYRAEIWTVSKTIISKLNAFHHRCAQHIVDKHIKLIDNGTWVYPMLPAYSS
jgi:pyrroloquinoline quinone (PQQ) biosynthesis protein C